MREELPPWARDEPEEAETATRRPRPWVLVLAVVPWLIVLGLVLSSGLPAPGPTRAAENADGDGARPPTSAGATPPDPAAADDDPAPTEETGTATAEPEETDATPTASAPATPSTTEGRPGPLEAVALAAARAWLTDVGPRLEIEGIEPAADLYLEHAVVEHVHRHGDHAVVTLLGVVLVRDGERYTRAGPRRLAVPVTTGDPPRPAGAPWSLGPVELDLVAPEQLVEVEAPEELLAISEALTAAGLTEELRGASRTTDGWWLARLEPPDGGSGPAPVWLHPTADGPAVPGVDAGGAAHQPEE